MPVDAPVVVGLDETIERRRGAKIAAKGIYRDPVRSSKSHFVKTSGLRWISMQLLAEVPWAGRIWGLPFLTVLAPSERYNLERGRRHKTLPEWGRQMIRQLRRWLPDRALVVVADSTYAVLELLADAAGLPQPVTVVTRLRLDAALYDPAPPREPGTKGRPRVKGERQPTLATRLLDPDTVWETLTVPWYGGGTASVEVATGTALWYHPGAPTVALRWVLLRDPAGQFEPQALLSTDPTASCQPRSSPGSSPAGSSKSPSRRSARTSASRPSANGRTSPSSAPPRPCSASSRSSPSSPTRASTASPSRSVRPPGTPRPPRPSPIPSPSSASSSGPSPFSRRHRHPTRSSKSPAPSSTASPIPWRSPPEPRSIWTKPS